MRTDLFLSHFHLSFLPYVPVRSRILCFRLYFRSCNVLLFLPHIIFLGVENTTLRGNNCQYQGIVRQATTSTSTSNEKESNPSRSAISFCNDTLEGVVVIDNTPYVLSQKLDAKEHEENSGSVENGLGPFNTSTAPFLRLPLHTLEPLQTAYNAHQALLAQLIPQSSYAATSPSSPSPHPTVTSTVLSSGSSEIGCHVMSKKPEDIFTENELLRGRQDLLEHFHEILQTSGRGIPQRAFSPLSQGVVASVMNTFRTAGVDAETVLDKEFEAILRRFDAESTTQAEGFTASDSSRDDTAAFSLNDLFRSIRGGRGEDEKIPTANPSETGAGGPLRRLIDPSESSTKYVELHIVTDYKYVHINCSIFQRLSTPLVEFCNHYARFRFAFSALFIITLFIVSISTFPSSDDIRNWGQRNWLYDQQLVLQISSTHYTVTTLFDPQSELFSSDKP